MSDSVEEKIIKLLGVARDNRGNANEAANALAMAQKLADANNLELSDVGKTGGRDDKKINKGLYVYQRHLYKSMAKLNHCYYFFEEGTGRGSKYTIRLLGSKMNVAMTRNFCDYVEDVANRLVKEEMVPAGHHYFSKQSHEFRDGVVDIMVDRIKQRREEEEAERRRAKAEQQARAGHPSSAGENAIVLIEDVAIREEEANYDHIHGEGAWARKREEERRAREEADRRYEAWKAEREQWKIDNPEEWAEEQRKSEERMKQYEKDAERKRKAAERRRQARIDKYGYDPQDYRNIGKGPSEAYYRGRRAANTVNLDDQVTKQNRGKLR